MLSVFVVLTAMSVWYVTSLPTLYASSSVIAFEPEAGRSDGRDLISLLVQTYPRLVASPSAVEGAAQASGVSASEVRSGLNAEIPPLTLTMNITTELSDPAAAQVANQFLVDEVVAAGNKDPYLKATAIANADFSDSPAGLSKTILLGVAIVLSGLLAFLAAVIAARLRISPS
jgi:hypothetical protein